MREEDNNKRNEDNPFSNILGKHSNLFLSVASVALIATLVYLNYTEPVNKSYSPNYLYTGYNDGEGNIDIRKKYNEMLDGAGVVDSKARCVNKTPTLFNKPTPFPASVGLNGNYWPVVVEESKVPQSEDDMSVKYAKDSSDTTKWYLWSDESDGITEYYIISPYRSFVFINENTENATTIKIAPSADNEYITVFHNVKNWYCHLNSTDTAESHMYKTSEFCKNELVSASSEMYILGMASEDTYVTIEKKDENTVTKTLWEAIANPE